MSKKAFGKIAAGLKDSIAIARGSADPSTFKVHVPADGDGLKIRRNEQSAADNLIHQERPRTRRR